VGLGSRAGCPVDRRSGHAVTQPSGEEGASPTVSAATEPVFPNWPAEGTALRSDGR
jgi:hypothetical protein